jgi:DNA-binding transcriptional MerR regulator
VQCTIILHMTTKTRHSSSDLIGTKEACRILDIDKSTLTRWVAKGDITPAMRVSSAPNSAMLFHRADIDALKAAS